MVVNLCCVMASPILYRLSAALSNFENSVIGVLSRFFPPGGPAAVALVGVDGRCPQPYFPSYEDVKSRSILAAVPRNRRSIERRMKRRFGSKSNFWKMLWYKKNLQSCIQCGNWHEPGLLCPHCFNTVIKETNEMQDKIQETLKLDPINQEVIVLYENEIGPEFHEGKRIVEMNKPRPTWFSKNLMQPSTQGPNANVKDLKPSDLA